MITGSVHAGQISVPSGPSAGFLLQSLSTGNYATVNLTAGSNITISTTTSNITISATGSSGQPAFTPTSYGASTSTTLGLLGGLFSTASSTFSNNLFLTSLSQGVAYIGSLGKINTKATSTPTITAPLTYSGTLGDFIGGVSGTFGCTSASSGITGCLTGTDWDTFNNKQATISATWPIIKTGSTLSFGGLSTSSDVVIGNIPYFSGVNTFANVATSTLTASSPLTGSFIQIGSSGSLGCQTASGSQAGCLSNTDWTTFNNKAGNSYAANSIITTNASGNLIATGTQLTVGNLLATTTATSTFSGGLTALYFNQTGTSATSTFARGIDLAGGCYAINHTCIGGSGSGTVTSVGLSLPTGFTVTNTPVTTTGTLTATLAPGFSIKKLPAYVVASSGGDFTTIQAALTQCGTDGGGDIVLTDAVYALGGTGATFRGSNCNIYARGIASTTVTITGATTAFKSNSAAGQYSNDGIHGIKVTGDGNASSIAFDLSDMTHFILEDNVIDNVGTFVRANDTQNISFYNTIQRNTATTLAAFGINASSTNPWNGNLILQNFIGCSANCISIQLNNANGNEFSNNYPEPGSTTGTIGINIFDNTLATNNGVFNNVFENNYIEANATGISIANTVNPSAGGIQRNRFSNNTVEANTLDYSLASNVVSLNTFDNNYDSNFGNPLTSFQAPFGIGTSTQLASLTATPFATFGINPTAGVALNQFAIGSSTGTNFIVTNGGKVGIATTTPFASFSVNTVAGVDPLAIGSSTATYFGITQAGGIISLATQPATTTTITLNWANTPTQVEYQIGTSATTITIINATTSRQWSSVKRVWVCNPGTTAGALTWKGVEWIGTAPVQTTTANQCDMYSFNVTRATSTSAYKVAGGGNLGLQ